MILSERMHARIADLYFQEQLPPDLQTDIVRYNQSPIPIPGSHCAPCATMVLDLSLSEDQLFAHFKSHTRQKIRRTREDKLTYEFCNTDDRRTILRFADHIDRCMDLKHLPKVSRKRLFILARQNALDMSWILDERGEVLCASSYVLTPGRVRGLYAGARFRVTSDPSVRTVIGRANRLLYWQDIVRFKNCGYRFFDFGGYYTGSEDEEKLRVNGFKEEFGGTVISEFNCQIAKTVKGKVLLCALRKRGEWIARRRPQPLEVRTRNAGSIPA